MTAQTAIHDALKGLLSPASVLRADEPMAAHTTLRVGGKADFYFEPASEEELAAVIRFCALTKLPWTALGRGSNMLVREGGIRGVVICLADAAFAQIHIHGDRLHCGAGAKLKAVATEARRHHLAGLEFLEGIPGSVGGALRMNAGAMGAWIFDFAESVRYMDCAGAISEHAVTPSDAEYRRCKWLESMLALGAVIKTNPGHETQIQQRMEEYAQKRWKSQPKEPSAGCIFKNPEGIAAGKLIDELGLKGTRVGGAMVSPVHANFIVNAGGATSRDVMNLIHFIQEKARLSRGICLETEVQIFGEEEIETDSHGSASSARD